MPVSLVKKVSNFSLRQTLFFALIFITLILLGAFGYVVIEKWHFFDALYMTVITLTTVGFSEIHALSPVGRVYTIFLILIGVGAMMTFITSFADLVVKRQVKWFLNKNTMKKDIDALSDHVIICGHSRLAATAIDELQTKGLPVVVVDCDTEKINDAKEEDLMFIHGDASKDETLQRAGVERASKIVCLMPKDSDNLYAVLAIRELNPNIFIIARAEDETGMKRMLQAGANKIISPYVVGSQKIADGLMRPHVTEFLDIATYSQIEDLVIEQILIPDNANIVGKQLSDTAITKDLNINVAAVIPQNSEMVYNPQPEYEISANDTLICFAKRQSLNELEKIIRIKDNKD